VDLSTSLLLAVVTLMGLNRLVFVIPNWERFRLPFWGVQFTNLGAACALVTWGIPEFREGQLQVVNLILAALMVMHIITNNRKLSRVLAASKRGVDEEREARSDEIMKRLDSDD
jgi:hypothetical protein